MTAFIQFAEEVLKEKLGEGGDDLLKRVLIKKQINARSNLKDHSDFVTLVTHTVSAISDQETADEIGSILNERLQDSVSSEAEMVMNKMEGTNLNAEIVNFLSENSLPSEADLADFSKYLSMKYGKDVTELQKVLTEKIKIEIKKAINKNKINDEILKFLKKFPEPRQKDIDDLIQYLGLLKLEFEKDQVHEQIEKVRLYLKFKTPEEEVEEPSEYKGFIDILKNSQNNESISKMLEGQNLGYIIRDETGDYDNSLSEFVSIMTPNEDDVKYMLEGLGLDHMIKKKV